MTTIALVSTKGGVGKTTLTGHIAVEAERQGGGPVGLFDMDPQGSLSRWWNAREAPTPVFLETGFNSLQDDLRKFEALGVRLTVVDTPPGPPETIGAAVSFADLVVIPLRPGPHDIMTVAATLGAIEPCARPVVFVLNGATVGARITGEAVSILSRYGPLAPVIHQRVDFAAGMIDGRTAMEIRKSSPAAAEIRALWRYLDGWRSRTRTANLARSLA
jgi:chromosome partitioning protein